MQVSVAETTKQNIFIHEFIRPKHASNPCRLTVQNGSQVGGVRALSSKIEGPDATAYHTVTISGAEESLRLVSPGQPEIPVSEKTSHHWLSTCPLALLSSPRAEGHRGGPSTWLRQRRKQKRRNPNSIWGYKWFRMYLLALLTPALCQEGSLVPSSHGKEGRGDRSTQSIA